MGVDSYKKHNFQTSLEMLYFYYNIEQFKSI